VKCSGVIPEVSRAAYPHALIGWIALTGAALLILLASLAGLGVLAWWRLTPAAAP
jgi:hypothetical protein